MPQKSSEKLVWSRVGNLAMLDIGRITNAAIFQMMNEVTPADAVIAVDVGNNAYS